MHYALLIYSAPEARAPYEPAGDGVFPDWVTYTQAMKDSGALVAAEQLQETDTATTVRLRGGERLLTDGPFVETKEALGGFFLIDVPNLDDALAYAAKVPAARNGGAVEVRPIVEMPS